MTSKMRWTGSVAVAGALVAVAGATLLRDVGDRGAVARPGHLAAPSAIRGPAATGLSEPARASSPSAVSAPPFEGPARHELEALLSALAGGEADAATRARLALLRLEPREVLRLLSSVDDDVALRELAELLRISRVEGGDAAELARLAALAREDGLPARRAAALLALGASGDGAVGELLRAARDDTAPEARLGAVEALARCSVAPAVVLDLAESERDPVVRCAIVSGVSGSRLDAPSVDRLAIIAGADRDAAVRQSAVMALADCRAEQAAHAMALLVKTLGAETDPVLRRSVLAAIVAVGRADALVELGRITALHSDLAEEARDYALAIREGAEDMESIWRAKKTREAARRPSHSEHGP